MHNCFQMVFPATVLKLHRLHLMYVDLEELMRFWDAFHWHLAWISTTWTVNRLRESSFVMGVAGLPRRGSIPDKVQLAEPSCLSQEGRNYRWKQGVAMPLCAVWLCNIYVGNTLWRRQSFSARPSHKELSETVRIWQVGTQ